MATENNRKILYIGGGIISLLIVTVITILWICLREPALVLNYSNLRINSLRKHLLIESYVKGEDRYLKETDLRNNQLKPLQYYLVNQIVWSPKSEITCYRLTDSSKFTGVDQIEKKALDLAKKVHLDKADGTKSAYIKDFDVTVTKKKNVFTHIIIENDQDTLTIDLNIKPPVAVFNLPAACK